MHFTCHSLFLDSIRYRAIGVLHRVFMPANSSLRLCFPHPFRKDRPCDVARQPWDRDGVSDFADRHSYSRHPPRGHGHQRPTGLGQGRDRRPRWRRYLDHWIFVVARHLAGHTQLSTGATWHTFVWPAYEELSAPTRHFLGWLALDSSVVAMGLLSVLGYVASGRIRDADSSPCNKPRP